MENIQSTLKKTFGHDDFRPGQRAVIERILSGGDVLAVMPTGGGKSLCYQLPALLRPGLALVLSPLVSLMKDQVDALKALGIAADWINSTLTPKGLKEKLERVSTGQVRILYAAPERLKDDEFLFLLNTLPVSLIAVDEAHCISAWGHDFRPSYKKIGRLLAGLTSRPPLAAFTATATPAVREEIQTVLGLRDPLVHVASFARPGLRFSVEKPADRMGRLQALLAGREESAIVYCATRKEVAKVADGLQAAGHRTLRYHAGLNRAARTEAQEAFLDAGASVLVATNAFGMGIDKPDVRMVVHYQMPRDLESYYQEAGRAGRDGRGARCILLLRPGDAHVHRSMIHARPAYYGGDRTRASERLLAMLRWCYGEGCLTERLLAHFGETGDVCNQCSACRALSAADHTRPAQMALCTLHYLNGRARAGLVPAVLRGARTKEVLSNGLDDVSTYGLLSDWPELRLSHLMLALWAFGYTSQGTGRFPRTVITAKGADLINGRARLVIAL